MAKKKARKKTPKVIFKERLLITVEYGDLEQFIKDKTGKDLEIPQILECANGTDHSLSVDAEPPTMKHEIGERAEMEAFLFGDGPEPASMSMYDVMDALCRKDLIKPGEYLIEVSW